MPIRPEKARLVDDSRSFNSEDLTQVWEWIDSFDAQPFRPRDNEQLHLAKLTFRLTTYTFGQRIYSVAKCSDGRELLGTVMGSAGTGSKWGPAALWSAVSRSVIAVPEA